MGQTTFTGPVKSKNGFQTGDSGTQITYIQKSSVAVTIATSAAAAEADVAVTVTGAVAGDAVVVTPLAAAAETGLAVVLAWVSATNQVTIRYSNVNAVAALSGSTTNWQVLLVRS